MPGENKFERDFSKSLPVEFFRRYTETVARELIGKVLVKIEENGEVLAGMIVETEAYRADGDLACHAAVGRTTRNAALFENGGIMYVYKIYGMHYCVNFVSESNEIGSGVLIRAIEPLSGIKTMMKNRGTENIYNLCKGPGNLAKAFNFTALNNFTSLTSPNLFVMDNDTVIDDDIAQTPRIGVIKSAELLRRYYLKKSPFISGKK